MVAILGYVERRIRMCRHRLAQAVNLGGRDQHILGAVQRINRAAYALGLA